MSTGSNIGAGAAASEIADYIQELLSEYGVEEQTYDYLMKILKLCDYIKKTADGG